MVPKGGSNFPPPLRNQTTLIADSMKLHLPLGLRSAIMACFALISGLATPAVTATVAGGAVVATFLCSAAPARAEAVVWDANWGATDAPSDIPDANVIDELPSGFTFLSATGSPYTAAGQTIVRLNGTAAGATGVAVVGGAGATTNKPDESEGPVTTDTWIKVTGGSYATLVGGSYAQNYQSGPLSSFTGDSHILLQTEGSGSPSVDYIIGGNYMDGQNAPFTGDSYISVEGGSVNGSIVGGGTSAHIQTSVFNGDSNVWVYTPLSSTAEARFDLPANLIVGGSAGIANYAPSLSQTGDSQVTVDVSSYSGAAAMEKAIIGDAWLSSGTTSTHEGNASVTIEGTAQGGANISFAQPVVAGSYMAGNGTASLSGDTELEVTGGSFTNALVGGTYLASGSASGVSSTIGGSTSVTLGGSLDMSGSAAMVIGGSYVNAASATLKSGAITLTLENGTYAGNIIGGSLLTEGSGTITQETGDISLTVNGGSVSGAIYGGSYTARNDAGSISRHGAISLKLAGGAILGDVYAGGGVAMVGGGASTALSGVTAASTQVEVSDAVALGSVTISGGVQNLNTASGVTGTKTLLLSGSNYANLDNATFEAFNVVNAASDATIKLNTIDIGFVKQGAGKLTFNGADSDLHSLSGLFIEAGALDTGSAWLTRNNQGLTFIAVGAGASLETAGLILADGAALALNVTGATTPLIAVGSAGGLSITGQKTLNLTLQGVESLSSGNQLTLMSWDNTEAAAPFDISNVTWENKGSVSEAYVLSIVGKSLVLTHTEELVWDGSASGTWDANSGNWEGQSSAPSNDKAVVFNTPTGETSTVTISGDVAPQSITVNNAADSSYTFEDAATGGAITGAASLTKNGEGELVVELANTYTGGTSVNGGTLEAAEEGALGTGAVALNAGELVSSAEDAVAANALELNGGTLNYMDDETRVLDTAGITHAAGVVPEVRVDNGSIVSWQYTDAAPLEAALGEGISLSGGGTLEVESSAAASNVALAGDISLEDVNTTLELASLGAKQLGTAAAPVDISLEDGTTLSMERPQADTPSVIHATLSGEGTLEFTNTNAAANSTVQLTGDNSAFEGSIDLGSEDDAPVATDDAPAVLLDYSEGSPVGGENSSLNLNGLGFATVLAGGAETTTEADVWLNRDTTQYAQTAGLNNIFTGDITGDAGTTWVLDATDVDGGQTNTLTGDLSDFDGTLEAVGKEGSLSRWVLGGEDAEENPILEANLSSADAFNEFVLDYADETTLSGAVTGLANLSQQGAGTLVLTGDNDSSGRLSISEGCTVQLGDADDAGLWGNTANGSTLAGAGTFTLVNGALEGTLAVEGTPVVNVDVAAGKSVDLGGNSGELITGSVTLASDATLTNVRTSILDRELNLTLASANIGAGAAGATAMVQFEDTAIRAARVVTASLGSETAAITLDANATSVVELLREHRADEDESYLTLTNGQLVTAADYSNVNFGPNMDILADLGLRIDRVEGGSVVLSGAAQGVYIAGAGEDATNVTGYQNFGAYQAVAVMPGETLTLNLDGEPDFMLDDDGAVINNLLGADNSALVINNTNTADEDAVVILNNSLQVIDPVPGGLPGDPVGANTTFGGSISQQGGDVELVKTGAGTLTVGGTVKAYQLTADEGNITLNASGNELEVLALEGGTVQLNNGVTTADMLDDTVDGGMLSIARGATLVTTDDSLLEDAQIGGTADGAGTLQVSGELTLAEDARLRDVALNLDGGTLELEDTGGHTVSALSGNGWVNGLGSANTVGFSVTGTGGNFAGALAGNGTLTVAGGAEQVFSRGFAGGAGWNLVNNGRMALDFVREDGSNAPMAFNALTLGEGSATGMWLNIAAPAGNVLTLGTIVVEPGATVELSSPGVENIVNADTRYVIGSVSGGQPAGTLATITPDAGNIAFMLLDAERSTLLVDEAGNLVLNLVTSNRNTLVPGASNPNSVAGAGMLWNGAFLGNTAVGTDLRRLLETLNSGAAGADADRILAAAAGSGVSVLSSALAADIERQLRAIRNRTTTMVGRARTAPCKGSLADDSPRFGAWINGEGDHRKMDASGFMPGYTLTSWGGTVGVNMSCDESLVSGLALTALYGDLNAHSADNAEGDFNRYYISAFARMTDQRWQHTLLATIGRLNGDLSRTVYYGTGAYRTHGNVDGWGYGLMYEVGYSIPMNEDETFTLQPVANVNWRIADVDRYTESGSDAALRVGDQDYNVVTFGAGFRMQAEVGESFINRRALFEGRALVKVDTGDRQGEATVAMLGGGGAWGKVRSEKLKAVGVELGAGISIPLGEDRGAIFIDGSAELRNSYSNLNGTIGYRFEF